MFSVIKQITLDKIRLPIMKVSSFLSFLMLIWINTAFSVDPKAARLKYIDEHKDDAVREMIKSGIPASITMAQACLESSDGNSQLAIQANNHFGIKCSNWSGPSYTQDDDEKDECFRKYSTALESYDDHSNFLKNRPRYASLFELDRTDYRAWAKGLKKAGYATDPAYADRLIKIIEDYQLHLLDLQQDLPLYADSKPQPPSTNSTSASTNTSNDSAISESINKKDVKEKKIFVPSVEIVDAFATRSIKEKNGIKYVVAHSGDTYQSLAKELNLGYWQLPKYNETEEKSPLVDGQIVYIQPKKKEGERKFYISKPGDTVLSISQEYGIKVRYIYKYNGLNEGASIPAGQKIYLQKNDVKG